MEDKRIVVVGGGHAGVEAAAVAAEAGAAVVLVAAEPHLPYFRPRLVALAFRQTDLAAIQLHPETWYQQRGIRLCRGMPVTAIDVERRIVVAGGEGIAYDALILATGSVPVVPPIAAGREPRVTPLWNAGQAQAIKALIAQGRRCAVVGGGVLGIETALRARAAGLQVAIIEKNERLMARHFGPRGSHTIRERLLQQEIEVVTGRGLTALVDMPDGALRLDFEDGTHREVDLTILAIGARPDLAAPRLAGIATERGVPVDRFLMANKPGIYAAGDVAQVEGVMGCSVREAVAQGRTAARNVLADFGHGRREEYRPGIQQLFFKTPPLEFYTAGASYGPEYREVCMDSAGDAFRAMITRNDVLQGIQMVGTREGFEELSKNISAG